jgi:transposase
MKTTNTAEPKLFIGIDIHKRSWHVHMNTDLFQGKGMSVPSSATSLKQYVDRHYPDHEVYTAYEAGCCGYSAHRSFESFGWHSLVFNPADLSRTGSAQHQKTDKIDAALICRELKDGRLTGISVPSVEREQLRCLFRRRLDLVKDYRQIKVRLKGQLLFLGIEIPQEYDNPNWSHGFRDWIRSLRFEHETMNYTLASEMRQFDFIDASIREVSNTLRKYCRQHCKKEYYLLRSIPGIGGIVACGILSELVDLKRFNNFKQLAAYVGLMPSMYESGGSSRSKGISPRGNRIMRSYFVEAAWQALRFDPVMQAYWRTHGGKDSKAILIKVARKLLSRTMAVMKTEIPYEIGVVK